MPETACLFILSRMKKNIISTFLVTFILTACSQPNPDMSDLRAESDAESESFNLSESTINNSQQDSNSPQKVQMNQNKPVKSSVSEFKDIKATQATIKTTKGDITVQLYREETPVTTANFLELADNGFYDGVVFHRVIEDFMAQVGDPLTKDPAQQQLWGTGDPGYKIIDEFNSLLKHDGPGVLSMANSGQPSTGGSQFFITFEATPWLDGAHTVFGKVTNGLEVLNSIEQGDKITTITYQ